MCKTDPQKYGVPLQIGVKFLGQVPNHGWIIRKTNEGQAGHIQLGSTEAGNGPRLVVEAGS